MVVEVGLANKIYWLFDVPMRTGGRSLTGSTLLLGTRGFQPQRRNTEDAAGRW